MGNGFTYEDAGVSIGLGNDASKVLYNAAKETWKNRAGKLGELIVPTDDFSGVRAVDVSGLPEGTLMNIGFDGVGTKMELAERTNKHDTIAFDLFAMVCDDAVVRGAEPVMVGSILDVNSLKDKHGVPQLENVRSLARGYIEAARAANVGVVNGEIAELGTRIGGYGSSSFVNELAHQYIASNLSGENYESIRLLSAYLSEGDQKRRNEIYESMGVYEREFVNNTEKLNSFNYNWGAAVVWFANKDKLFTGREIEPGNFLVGLQENGFRSNGLSLVRKIMENTYGNEWHREMVEGKALGELVLEPSTIYSDAVCDMFGGFNRVQAAKVNGVAHVTGGGLPEKLGRMLRPSGLGAKIDNPLEPPFIMQHCQEMGNVSDREAYGTWNMGSGMVIATPEPEKIEEIADKNGLYSDVIGKVTDEYNGIEIRNKGVFGEEKSLRF